MYLYSHFDISSFDRRTSSC